MEPKTRVLLERMFWVPASAFLALWTAYSMDHLIAWSIFVGSLLCICIWIYGRKMYSDVMSLAFIAAFFIEIIFGGYTLSLVFLVFSLILFFSAPHRRKWTRSLRIN